MSTSESIGIDIGGTNIKAIRLAADGGVLADAHRPTPMRRDELIDALQQTLTELRSQGDEPLGVASPGLAEPENRSIRWMRGRLESVEGLHWSDALGRPATVLNDAHAATLGEASAGAAAGKRHVVMLTLGTGVGGGVLVDGKLLQGASGRAGHLGHVCLDYHGEADIVGTPGSLEDLVGAHTLLAASQGRYAQMTELLAGCQANDPEAIGLWNRRVRALAAGLVSLINAFDPEVVVLGGGIPNAGAWLFDELGRWMKAWEWRPLGESVPIVPAALGDRAGAIGAARFAVGHVETAGGVL